MKNKIILFDWGNIVEAHTTGYNNYDAWEDLLKECGYTGKDNIFDHLAKYRFSCIQTVDEFEKAYEKMIKEFGLNKTFKEFIEIYRRIFDKIDYYKDVAEFEVSLKDRCCVGIFSNLDVFDKDRLDKQVNLSKYDYVFLSFEMGLRKPDIKMYNIVQDKLPFAPEDILFIDDRTDNIETAKKMGWNTFQSTGLELDKIKKKCDEFLSSVKRRYANNVEGDYKQKRIESDYFIGEVCHIKLKGIKKPFIVSNDLETVCIKDNDFEWYELYPDSGNYVLTIMYDNKDNLIEWYFDVVKNIGLDNGIPYDDDLFLDMVITPSGEYAIIDEDELKSAKEKGFITKNDVDKAYEIIDFLKDKFVNNFKELKDFTNELRKWRG